MAERVQDREGDILEQEFGDVARVVEGENPHLEEHEEDRHADVNPGT
jgi:hypothetical protein